MKRKSRKLFALGLCLALTICMGNFGVLASRTGSVELEDRGCRASGSSSIGGTSASASTQGNDSNMQTYVYGHYVYYTDYNHMDLEHMDTQSRSEGNYYHASVSFSAGTYGRSIRLETTHSFTYGSYNDSKDNIVYYP